MVGAAEALADDRLDLEARYFKLTLKFDVSMRSRYFYDVADGCVCET